MADHILQLDLELLSVDQIYNTKFSDSKDSGTDRFIDKSLKDLEEEDNFIIGFLGPTSEICSLKRCNKLIPESVVLEYQSWILSLEKDSQDIVLLTQITTQ